LDDLATYIGVTLLHSAEVVKKPVICSIYMKVVLQKPDSIEPMETLKT